MDVKKNTKTVRIALFTHDTFGMGHVKRSLHIIQSLSKRHPDSAILLISGTPILHLFDNLPRNADFIKIPTVAKTGAPESQPPHLPLKIPDIIRIRSQIIRQAICEFNPHVFYVDNFPLGTSRELLPVLQAVQLMKTRTIVGLRDVTDAPDTTRTNWLNQGIYDALQTFYDRILVYGCREIFDVVEKYSIPENTASKVRYCGYLTATGPLSVKPAAIRKELGIAGKMVLVTGGGGGDAYPLYRTLLRALPHLPALSILLVLGPMMGKADREQIRKMAARYSNVILRDYLPDLPGYMKAADLVVSMCGYNIAAEIVVHRPKAIVVPRTWRYGEHLTRTTAVHEGEQIIRAQSLSRLGLAALIEPENLNPSQLAGKIREALKSPHRKPRITLNLRGLENAIRYLEEMFPAERNIQ